MPKTFITVTDLFASNRQYCPSSHEWIKEDEQQHIDLGEAPAGFWDPACRKGFDLIGLSFPGWKWEKGIAPDLR